VKAWRVIAKRGVLVMPQISLIAADYLPRRPVHFQLSAHVSDLRGLFFQRHPGRGKKPREPESLPVILFVRWNGRMGTVIV
jgi:hypothetical protein